MSEWEKSGEGVGTADEEMRRILEENSKKTLEELTGGAEIGPHDWSDN